jgi:NAD(P)-dependent dehydrogenase (short-subunit alcohol dehydrogenase family)
MRTLFSLDNGRPYKGYGAFFSHPLEDLEENVWDRAINLNLKATYVCSRVVIKYMKIQRSGIKGIE